MRGAATLGASSSLPVGQAERARALHVHRRPWVLHLVSQLDRLRGHSALHVHRRPWVAVILRVIDR